VEIPEGWGGGVSDHQLLIKIIENQGREGGGDVLRQIPFVVGLWSFSVSSTQ